MSQTVHALNMAQAFPGLVADSGLVQDTISRLAEDAAGVGAGQLVCPGTLPEEQAVVPVAAADITTGDCFGVVQYDASKEPALTAAAIAANNQYDDEDALPIMQKGRIWVRCDAAATIAAGGQCFVRYAAGAGGTVLGRFREDDPGAEAAALPNCRYVSAHQDVVFQADTYRVALAEISLPTV